MLYLLDVHVFDISRKVSSNGKEIAPYNKCYMRTNLLSLILLLGFITFSIHTQAQSSFGGHPIQVDWNQINTDLV